jgi:hypothetical protein
MHRLRPHLVMALALFLVVISGTSVEAQEPCEPSSTFYEMISGATPVAFPQATPVDFPEATPGASPEATPVASPGATPAASPGATPAASPGAMFFCRIDLTNNGVNPLSAGIWAGTTVTFKNASDVHGLGVRITQPGPCEFYAHGLGINETSHHIFPVQAFGSRPVEIDVREPLTCDYEPDFRNLPGQLVIFALPTTGIGFRDLTPSTIALLAVMASVSAATAFGLRRR